MNYASNTINFCIVLIGIFFNPLWSMDQTENKEIGLLLSKQIQALSVLLHHRIDLDHDTICSLAVNKELEKILKDTAIQRKKCLTFYITETLPSSVVWHKYGSACGTEKVVNNGSIRQINLEAFYLDTQIAKQFFTRSIFEKKLSSMPYPFFNENGDFCLYGIKKSRMCWGQSQHIIEYCLKRYEFSSDYRCGLSLNKNGYFRYSNYALSYFQTFPVLLKAFLNSKIDSLISNFGKLYSLEDAIIPDNYKECIPDEKYKSFDDLPEELKKAIENRYANQKK